MAQPFSKMPAEQRDSTCSVLSMCGMTDVHATWIRKPGLNARALIEWIDQRIAAEEAAAKKAAAEKAWSEAVPCLVRFDDSTGVDCPKCKKHHDITRPEKGQWEPYGITCSCGHAFTYKIINMDFAQIE